MLKPKIRRCFFSMNQAKMLNYVSASTATQHIEAAIDKNNNLLDSVSRFCCQSYFISLGLQISASLSVAHMFAAEKQ